jgi:hypothetical protein
VWSLKLDNTASTNLVIDFYGVSFLGVESLFRAIDGRTGALLWSLDIGLSISPLLLLEKRSRFLGAEKGALAIETSSKSTLWEVSLDFGIGNNR